ncbi:cytidine deaminase [Alteromonas oceanisediminis]|uniref:cytidine deaminase n=1 Tax=Alteromonas oceanisediminis TaxID=2836180 RepID=UPI001BDB1390|nr:cytidine deaminase [Alteromonas oceanisediminis]MBT0586510.1 cytidine deaminase [Alteromonas oceanisediminis]
MDNDQTDINKINQRTTALLSAARQAQTNAYAPYSGFKVGAALLNKNGDIFTGCNVENAAFPLGQCAEASAISAMVAAGSQQLSRILIVSPNEEHCFPCGGCRQKIAEFAHPETVVIMATQSGSLVYRTITQLLPDAFNLNETPT